MEMKRENPAESQHLEDSSSMDSSLPSSISPQSTLTITDDIKLSLQVDFPSEEKASMVYTALSVDKELQPDKVKREMILSGCQLLVHFSGVEVRFLRASSSAFMDILVLATKTIEEFGSN